MPWSQIYDVRISSSFKSSPAAYQCYTLQCFLSMGYTYYILLYQSSPWYNRLGWPAVNFFFFLIAYCSVGCGNIMRKLRQRLWWILKRECVLSHVNVSAEIGTCLLSEMGMCQLKLEFVLWNENDFFNILFDWNWINSVLLINGNNYVYWNGNVFTETGMCLLKWECVRPLRESVVNLARLAGRLLCRRRRRSSLACALEIRHVLYTRCLE